MININFASLSNTEEEEVKELEFGKSSLDCTELKIPGGSERDNTFSKSIF